MYVVKICTRKTHTRRNTDTNALDRCDNRPSEKQQHQHQKHLWNFQERAALMKKKKSTVVWAVSDGENRGGRYKNSL